MNLTRPSRRRRLLPSLDRRHRSRRRASPSLAKPNVPVAVAEVVQRHYSFVIRLHALQPRGIAIEMRAEAPDEVAAVLVLESLHPMEDCRALGGVQRSEGARV